MRRQAEPRRSGLPPGRGNCCHLAQLCSSGAVRLLTCHRRELGAPEGSVSRLCYWGGGRRGTLLPMPLPWACAPSASWRSACPQGTLAGPLKGTSPRPRHAFRLFFSFPVTVIRCSMFFSCLIVFDKELISPGQGCLFNLPLCPQCLDWYLGTGVSQ